MSILNWLNSEAIHVVGVSVSWAEVMGDATGLLSVWWAAKEHVWNWPVGLVNSAMFLVLFTDARLFANATLQIAFILLGIYGWWSWLRRDEGTDQLEVPIRRTNRAEWIGIIVAVVTAQIAVTTLLSLWADSPAPFWDSLVLVLSLAATFGQARKLIESWWIWIAVDMISVPLYLSQGLYPTAALYVVFGVLCVLGLRTWSAAIGDETTTAVQVV